MAVSRGVSRESISMGATVTAVWKPRAFPKSWTRARWSPASTTPTGLRDDFARCGDRVACFIVEPFIGAGGFIPATREYLQTARALTERYGAILIFDEVISGFRFRAGNVGALYGIQPDLATFGKVAGGGMPVAAVAGRADLLIPPP